MLLLAQQAPHPGDAAAGALVCALPCCAILFGVLAFGFWIWMLIDALTRLPSDEKLVWVLVIVFLHFLGALIYFFVGRKHTNVR